MPDAVVIVATVRALKMHGGKEKSEVGQPDVEALRQGLPNLAKHIENISRTFNLPTVVAINRFPTDTDQELELVRTFCAEQEIAVVLSDVWSKGGEGAVDLAHEVVRLADHPVQPYRSLYDVSSPIPEKIRTIVQKIYGGDGVVFTDTALGNIARLERLGLDKVPVCMAKTQYSLSDDAKKLARPKGFTVKVRDIKLSAGAGFVVVLSGTIMTMPGLPKIPAAEHMDMSADGSLSGIF